MICPSCQAENRSGARGCRRCHKALPRLSPGDVVAERFEILQLLGMGGMGVVFRAVDRVLDETVALKMLRDDLDDAEEMARRFRSEISLARRISSPHVCRIHEYGSDGDLQYFSMECVDGVTVKQLVRQSGAMPADVVLDMMDQVLAGLTVIHNAGIMHRDVKPSNLMRSREGVIKLMDFGIAKQLGGVTLTTAGQAVGTPEYMSPEQLMGRQLDLSTDVYTTGIVIYELLTGISPFQADTPMSSAHKQVTETPALDVPGIPPVFVPVLRRALSKDRETRFASAPELGEALKAIRGELPSSPASPEGGLEEVLPPGAPADTPPAIEADPPALPPASTGPPPSTDRSQAMMPPPVTAVLTRLRGPDPAERRQAVLSLAELGPRSPAAVRALADTLKDPDGRLRFMAAGALGRIGPAAEPAVPSLLKALEDEAAGKEAAESLVRIGMTAVPTLIAVMERGESELSLRAAAILARIGAGQGRTPPD